MNISFLELPKLDDNIIIVNSSYISKDDTDIELNLPIATQINAPIEIYAMKYQRQINFRLLGKIFYTIIFLISILLGIILILYYKIYYGYILFLFGLINGVLLFCYLQN